MLDVHTLLFSMGEYMYMLTTVNNVVVIKKTKWKNTKLILETERILKFRSIYNFIFFCLSHCTYTAMSLIYPSEIQSHIVTVSTGNTEPYYHCIHYTCTAILLLYPLHIQNYVLTVFTAHTELCFYCTHCT